MRKSKRGEDNQMPQVDFGSSLKSGKFHHELGIRWYKGTANFMKYDNNMAAMVFEKPLLSGHEYWSMCWVK